MATNSFTLKNFYEWIAEDSYLGSTNSVQYMEQLDTLNFPKYVSLAPSSVKKVTTTAIGNVIKKANLQEWVFTADGKVYNIFNGNNVYTLTSPYDWDSITAWILFDGYFYFFTDTAIHRIAEWSMSTWAASWTVTQWFKTWLNNTVKRPLLLFFWELFIGNGNNLQKLDSLGNLTSELDFEDNDIVTWLSTVNTQMVIYTQSGKVFTWDWSSASPSQQKDYNESIRYILEVWDTDWLVAWETGNNAKLIKTIFPQQITIASSTFNPNLTDIEWEDILLFDFDTQNNPNNDSLAYEDWVLYVPWQWALSANPARLYTYGNRVKWLPQHFSVLTTKNDDDNELDSIWAIYCKDNTLYYSWDDWVWFWVDQIIVSNSSSPFYQNTGYLITRILDANLREEEKRPIEFKIWCDIPTNTSILIEYRPDWWSWTTIKNITAADTKRFKVNKNLKSCYEMEFRITLNTTSSSVTPRFYNMKVTYDIINT